MSREKMQTLFSNKTCYLILDTYNIVYRAFYVADSRGRPFTPILETMLDKLERDFPGHTIVMALEGSGATKRKKVVENYKTGRTQRLPKQALKEGIEVALQHSDYVILSQDGEADDAIAAFIEQKKDSDISFVIVSEDRDLYQLVNSRVQILDKKGHLLGPKEVFERLGVKPKEIKLWKALQGDKSDCIQGVPGIGHKTATKLARKHKTLKNLLSNLGGKNTRIESLVDEYRNLVKRNYKVVKLNKRAQILFLPTKEFEEWKPQFLQHI